jgi:hypothetical protein
VTYRALTPPFCVSYDINYNHVNGRNKLEDVIDHYLELLWPVIILVHGTMMTEKQSYVLQPNMAQKYWLKLYQLWYNVYHHPMYHYDLSIKTSVHIEPNMAHSAWIAMTNGS